MSHHVSASPSNPTGAVEVVRVSNSAATTAPVDTGSSAAAASGTATPSAQPVFTEVAGQSGTPGANLPVADIEQASNTIQNARADLARTAGAERRLDGFDGVGGGGGGGGDNAGAGQENADNATGAVAQGTDDLNVSDQQGGLGAQTAMGEQAVTSVPQTEARSAEV
jgi:hypothetical protein